MVRKIVGKERNGLISLSLVKYTKTERLVGIRHFFQWLIMVHWSGVKSMRELGVKLSERITYINREEELTKKKKLTMLVILGNFHQI